MRFSDAEWCRIWPFCACAARCNARSSHPAGPVAAACLKVSEQRLHWFDGRFERGTVFFSRTCWSFPSSDQKPVFPHYLYGLHRGARMTRQGGVSVLTRFVDKESDGGTISARLQEVGRTEAVQLIVRVGGLVRTLALLEHCRDIGVDHCSIWRLSARLDFVTHGVCVRPI